MVKENIEDVLDKVTPIVEDAMKNVLGVSVDELEKDITDQFSNKAFINLDVDISVPFKEAKKLFKKNYIERLLKTYYGEVTLVASIAGVDRRTLHRFISEFKINIKGFRKSMLSPDYVKKRLVTKNVRKSLDDYKDVIHPKKMEKMYKVVPALSDDVLRNIDVEFPTLEDAEDMFEKEYFRRALADSKGNVSKAARKVGLRYETLHRKLKDLGISDEN